MHPSSPSWKRHLSLIAVLILPMLSMLRGENATTSLTQHLHSPADLGELRDLQAEWTDEVLKLSTSNVARHAWAIIPARQGGWDLARRATVSADIVNTCDGSVRVMFWIVGNRGWSAVVDAATLAPGAKKTFSCNLRETYPDGTPKLNPGDVKQVQVMLSGPIRKSVSMEVRNLTAQGEAPEWHRPLGRIDVPMVEDAPPEPGKRVRYRLPEDQGTGIYSVLNLPENWQKGKRYPLIVEYPGNIFYAPACYSTGRPEQCVIGYGITKGKEAICLGMPFLERATGEITENAWGNPDDTADYVVRTVAEICDQFGGDRENILLTGFSRGAIACGYIGLRDDSIASLWKGFHACQHSDGSGWNGSDMEGAVVRASRFRGVAVFQTDNSPQKFQPVMDAMKTKVTWAESGLGFHSTAMFLDDRPSTQQLREWFWQLVRTPRAATPLLPD